MAPCAGSLKNLGTWVPEKAEMNWPPKSTKIEDSYLLCSWHCFCGETVLALPLPATSLCLRWRTLGQWQSRPRKSLISMIVLDIFNSFLKVVESNVAACQNGMRVLGHDVSECFCFLRWHLQTRPIIVVIV
jgi:hypothetical protein